MLQVTANRGEKCNAHGMHMTFDNGNTISIQWSKEVYSSNRSESSRIENGCVSAEVAIWDKEGTWARMHTWDTIAGWQDADEIAKLIHMASTMSVEEISELNKTEEDE